jgi:hypothetical protein
MLLRERGEGFDGVRGAHSNGNSPASPWRSKGRVGAR